MSSWTATYEFHTELHQTDPKTPLKKSYLHISIMLRRLS